MTRRPASRARLSASRLLPERAPPMISSFMAGILGEGRPAGNRYNFPFDQTEPGANPGRARRCNRGPTPQRPLPTGNRPGGKARPRDDPKARRRVESCGPLHIGGPRWKPVDRASRLRSEKRRREALLLLENRMHSFEISAADRGLEAALNSRIDRKTKPLGAFGQLERLAVQVGLIQQSLTPRLNNPQILVFAGDHGAAKAGVSVFSPDVTGPMVERFLAGGAAITVVARQNGLGLSVVDAGVAHDFGDERDGLIDLKIAPGTANYLEQPAMSVAQCAQAIEQGAGVVLGLAVAGCNVVGFGEMGIGNTASASLLTHCLTGTPLAECVGRGTGLDDAGLARKRGLLEQAMQRYREAGGDNDPFTVLAEFGGFEIATMVGAMLAAAEAKMVLLIDGFIVSSAALVAARLQPAVLDYCVFCTRSAEPGAQVQLAAMNAEPLLDLGLRLGEGTGAALAYPLLQAAVNFLNEMASFESAGVADKCTDQA